ncbi:MAG: ADP-glyceromanno-heptose 6-epimerase [Verrucomicrobia bacterium]|nr:ADP-glyceromanno-heptose 6-epimerase [Verrucomicrobiota bacterium]
MPTPRYIVTGGAGFIGSNLVAALNARGHDDILIVDHTNHPAKQRNLKPLHFRACIAKDAFRARLHAGDIAPPATVFHLGACSSTMVTDAAYLNDNNLAYTQELCTWCLAHGVRFVYASSAATYGDGTFGYADDDALTPRLQPLNLYGWSKQNFDRWALANGHLQGIAGIKYFNVYGPGEDHKEDMRSLINKAHAQILSAGALRLFKSHNPRYADGEQERDFVYVHDAVRVTLFFHDHPEVSGLYNCGTGQARTWLDLGQAIFAAMDRAPQIEMIDIPVAIRDKYQYHTQADMRKLRAAGYRDAFASVEAGVDDYVRNHLNNRGDHS